MRRPFNVLDGFQRKKFRTAEKGGPEAAAMGQKRALQFFHSAPAPPCQNSST